MNETTSWVDRFSFIFSLLAIAGAIIWVIYNDTFSAFANYTEPPTWQLIRSTGLTAYILCTLSALWGLALSSKIVKDWSPGTLSILLHASTSWLAVIFGATHAILLLFDKYFTYHIADLLVPFQGPYRPFAVGLGTLGFWTILIVTISFSVKKRIGHQRWKLLHYTSYLGFGLISLHALLSGADAHRIGFLFLLGIAMMSVIILWGYRMGMSSVNSKKKVAGSRRSNQATTSNTSTLKRIKAEETETET